MGKCLLLFGARGIGQPVGIESGFHFGTRDTKDLLKKVKKEPKSRKNGVKKEKIGVDKRKKFPNLSLIPHQLSVIFQKFHLRKNTYPQDQSRSTQVR